MKKLIAVMMAAIILVSFTGCNFILPALGTVMAPKQNNVIAEEIIENTENTEGNTDAPKAEAQEDDLNDIISGFDNNTDKDGFNSVVVFDEKDYYLEINGIDDSDEYYYIIETTAENKTSDSELLFEATSCYVNDLFLYSYYYNDVNKKSRVTENIEIYRSNLEEVGIDKITKITLVFEVRDYDSYETIDTAAVDIYPYGENEAETFERKPLSTDKTLIDSNGVKVTFIGFEDSYGTLVGKFYVENNSVHNIWLTTEKAEINDKEGDLLVYSELVPGTKGLSKMYIYDFELEEFDLDSFDDINKIDLELAVYETEDYEKLATKTVTLKP